MLPENTPIFRKVIVSWYDSVTACVLMLVFLDAVFLFAVTGINVACEMHEYSHHIWVPVLLMALSACGALSLMIRLIRRYVYHMKLNKENISPP